MSIDLTFAARFPQAIRFVLVNKADRAVVLLRKVTSAIH
jgi:hypothetical protein